MALTSRCRAFARRATAALLLVAVAFTTPAQEALYDADQVKAAFLYHFGTYVQWPAAAPETDPITIAVLDEPTVAAQLAEFLPGRRIQGRAVEVATIAAIEDVGDAEVLFIGRAQNPRLTQLIAALGRRPTLVVTDAENGLDSGAMVNFQLVDSRVRFEISLPRAEEAGIVLSSRLLSAALRVETSECCWNEAERGFAVAAPQRSARRGRRRHAREARRPAKPSQATAASASTSAGAMAY
jgi:hypothetical protein